MWHLFVQALQPPLKDTLKGTNYWMVCLLRYKARLRHLGWWPLALLYTQVKQRGNFTILFSMGTVSHETD